MTARHTAVVDRRCRTRRTGDEPMPLRPGRGPRDHRTRPGRPLVADPAVGLTPTPDPQLDEPAPRRARRRNDPDGYLTADRARRPPRRLPTEHRRPSLRTRRRHGPAPSAERSRRRHRPWLVACRRSRRRHRCRPDAPHPGRRGSAARWDRPAPRPALPQPGPAPTRWRARRRRLRLRRPDRRRAPAGRPRRDPRRRRPRPAAPHVPRPRHLLVDAHHRPARRAPRRHRSTSPGPAELPSAQLIGTTSNARSTSTASTPPAFDITGKLAAVKDGRAQFSGSLANLAASADLKLHRLLDRIDQHIADHRLENVGPTDRPPLTDLPAAVTDIRLDRFDTIIWATGYRANHRCSTRCYSTATAASATTAA